MAYVYAGFDLDGQVALVTGSASGIGRGIALGLAQAGATVVLSDRPGMEAELDSACAQAAAAGGGPAHALVLDVTDTAGIAPALRDVVAAHGRLDVLVNNAGTGIARPAIEVDEADWDRILDLNLKSQFFCAQAAARIMAAQGGGRIVNIASTHALIALANGAPYIASKGGVAALTRSLALEWIGLGVRVNAIAPGLVHTEYKARMDAVLGRSDEAIREDMRRRVPLGRRLRPDEMQGAAIFLASEASSGVVGHLLVVDGGQVIH